MLNAELFHQARRKNSTGKSAAKDGGKLSVETADAHVFEFKVGGENGICRAAFGRVFELDAARGVFDPDNFGALHDDAGRARTAERSDVAHGRFEIMAVVIEHDRLERGQWEGWKGLY